MAFNLTLFLTSIIGAAATLAQSYIQLCVVMFFLGTAVGVRAQPP
jgi:type III secretory pathway component EscR